MLSMPLIGTDFLFQFKMIINYPKDEMLLIPNTDSHFEDNQFSLGLNLNLSENNEILFGLTRSSSFLIMAEGDERW